MRKIPTPVFQDKLSKISWKKIYAREYGVQYSEMAILCLSPRARYHIPGPSVNQVVIPEGNNSAFYIDDKSWNHLVESLNNKYTSVIKKLKDYERQFVHVGKDYLETAKRISSLDLRKLSNSDLSELYDTYQKKLFNYSVFAWTSFILNNYISEKSKIILDRYIKEKQRLEESQDIYNALFKPEKRAAIFELQHEVQRHLGKLTVSQFNDLYVRFRWLSCLDIHNKPWSKREFRKHIKAIQPARVTKETSFAKLAKELKIKKIDLDYLLMAKRFVYIKDARDDFRRHGVFYAQALFREIARRMKIAGEDLSYLQQSEIEAFLDGKLKISKKLISERKRGFVLYLNKAKKLVCLKDREVQKALKAFKLFFEEEKTELIKGTVASKGTARGRVVIVKGVKDLNKVKDKNILVAIMTHPDYVPAMKRAEAVVTDEGGITSHAAIVSREFGIPCIVGTKIATKVLKDGDLVEVDAVKGIVRKLD